MKELMAEFWNKELPSKKKEYVEYSNMEWEDLACEKNLTDETLRNIVVEQDKGGLEWLDHRGYQLNPSKGTRTRPPLSMSRQWKSLQW